VVGAGKAPASFGFEALEHCTQDVREVLFVDGITGSSVSGADDLITARRTEIAETSLLAEDDTLVIAPEQRASAIVRQLLAKLMRPLQADTVFEESLSVEALELFYRPIWAFEFHHKGKDKRGVVEVDGLTGEVKTATSLKVSHLTRMVSRDALFDIGADTVGLIVPGGSIAVKLARVAIDRSY
jgi:hypothetical protein